MIYTTNQQGAVAIDAVSKKQLTQLKKRLSPANQAWLESNQYQASRGQVCLLPDEKGRIRQVLVGVKDKQDWQALASACLKLPAGKYQLASKMSLECLLYWGLSQYQFDKYKKVTIKERSLVVSAKQLKLLTALMSGVNLTRTLINTPAEEMGPAQLAASAQALATEFGASYQEVVGEALLEQNLPAIHAVGRASSQAPRLCRLRWGNPKHPLFCLVGKGVCFDTGGLDLKPSNAMRLMKKDMGGAAQVMGLAKLIMMTKLPVQIEVIIPAVENAVSGNALRPGDVISTRQGLSVEIGNTDAEGRLILADALTLASELKPALIIDFATLTGAARVAVGTDIAAMFSNHQSTADKLQQLGEKHHDPIWQLPLFAAYKNLIQPPIADLSNSGDSPYAGAITAALFLESFVKSKLPWVHFDVMAWNVANQPGKPKGGEAMAIRAVYELLKAW